jgi:ribosomal protein S18 acetylase RimI-like enzyme
MSNVSVRRAASTDIGRIAYLFDMYRQFYEQPPDLDLATHFISTRFDKNESILFVASIDAQDISGFCQLYPTFCSVEAARVLTLYDLFTSPESRSLGVGRSLMLAAEQHAIVEGYKRLDLTTAKTNSTAQALYEALGWKRDEVFYAYSRHIAA